MPIIPRVTWDNTDDDQCLCLEEFEHLFIEIEIKSSPVKPLIYYTYLVKCAEKDQ